MSLPSPVTAAWPPRRRLALLALALTAVLSGTLLAAPVRSEAADPAAASAQVSPLQFNVATFNVLGYDHTRSGPRSRIFEDGRTRMSWAVDLYRAARVSVVGMQELQPEQLQRFRAETGGRWAVYPGDALDPRVAMHNSIAWRKKRWLALDTSWMYIPYFDGKPFKMPVVTLQHRETGRIVAFANFHNPANTRGDAERWRDEAMRRQIELANDKAAEGVPLIITGDMNEREDYFCPMTARAPMIAAAGGGWYDGRCEVPRWAYIDWIFGHRSFRFSNYQMVRDGVVDRISDHPFIVATATLP